ncbi:hypothetical protein ACOSQ4_013756 [Xanthoceras sorbifolium]
MSMAVESSSTIQRSEQPMAALPILSPLIAKSMNFNLPIKLDYDNYIHWKVLVIPAILVSDRDLLLIVMNWLGHEYDPVVELVSQQTGVTLYEAQYMLMIHEQMIAHQSSVGSIEISPSTNFVNNSNGRGVPTQNPNRGAHQSGGRR